jgi:hypothetical protein
METPDADGWRVTFTILQAFRGVDSKEVDLHLPDSSCNPNFEEGKSYLVYAHHRSGAPGWTTTSCTRTRLLSEASEDLAYLRLPDSEKGPSRIVGEVLRRQIDLSNPAYPRVFGTPVEGVPVRVTGRRSASEARTDARGRFSIPAPAYEAQTVTFGSVGGLLVDGGYSVTIPHGLACAAVDGQAYYDGRVTGMVVDSAGRPIPFFPIFLRLYPRTSLIVYDQDAMTDANGRFTFRRVQPERYVIRAAGGHPRDDESYPELGPENPVAVGAAARIDAGRLALASPSRAALIEGVVLDDAGLPAGGVRISVRLAEAGWGLWDKIATDARGRFRISLTAGRRYEISAWAMRQNGDAEVRLSDAKTF